MFKGLFWCVAGFKGTHKTSLYKLNYEIAYKAFLAENNNMLLSQSIDNVKYARFFTEIATFMYYRKNYLNSWNWAFLLLINALKIVKLPHPNNYVQEYGKLFWPVWPFKTTVNTISRTSYKYTPKRYIYTWWLLQISSLLCLSCTSTFKLPKQPRTFNSQNQISKHLFFLPR